MESPQETFDSVYPDIPRQAPFWRTTIGNPGRGSNNLLGFFVYYRGAMTLQALRNAVGDADFFTILETWAHRRQGKLVTTPQFIRLAGRPGPPPALLRLPWRGRGEAPPVLSAR